MRLSGPRGLLGRFVLIVVVPIVLLQLTVAVVLIQRHYDRVTRQLTEVAAAELVSVLSAIDRAGSREEARLHTDRLSDIFGIHLQLERGDAAPVVAGVDKGFLDITGGVSADVLRAKLPVAVHAVFPPGSSEALIRARTRHGTLFARVPRERLVARNPYLVLTWSAGASILLIVIALLYLTNQIRPIRKLAAATEAFGTGVDIPLRPTGAREVRQAIHSFTGMRRRIRRHIEQRTLIPMALSHDLRTPITRMRLALEDEGNRAEIRQSLDEMEAVVNDFLDFARAEWREEQREVDAHQLLRQAAQSVPHAGVQTECALESGHTSIQVRAGAMRRCLGNLIENAARHGNRIRTSVSRTQRMIIFCVDDDGPGIPEARRAEMMEPFSRGGEAGKPPQSLPPGMGLGLAIARDVARLHGGELRLEQSPVLGGLRAVVVIPAEPPIEG